MLDFQIIRKLMSCFQGSFINYNQELIFNREANSYFRLEDCTNELDLKRKVLEWLSSIAHMGLRYSDRKSKKMQDFHLTGVNKYLGTDFSPDEMELIYCRLGNAVAL